MNLEWSILLPAFLAGILVLSTHVPLGQEVLARGIIFIDLAVAQIAGVGVILAHNLGWEAHGWQVQALAISAALLGALLLSESEKRWPDKQEALIGTAFVLAASASILLLANNPNGGEHLKDLLVGQILWVDGQSLVVVAVSYTIVLGLWFGLQAYSSRLGFYLLFAASITASVQLVGVYLVFASLIIPALATRRLTSKWRLFYGYGVGIIGYAVGLWLSAWFDLPTGAVVVWALAGVAVGSASIVSLLF